MTTETIGSTTLTRKVKYEWLQLLKDAKVIGLDTESSGLNQWEKGYRVNGFSLAVRRGNNIISEYFPTHHIRGTNLEESEWRPILREAIRHWIVCHNVNFDRKNVELLTGIRAGKFFDTTRLTHLHNENWGGESDLAKKARSLENMTKEYLGYGAKKKSAEFEGLMKVYGFNEIAPSEIDEYACADAEGVLLLGEVVITKLNKSEPTAVQYYYDIDLPNFNTLYDMKDLGISINQDFCREMKERGEYRMAEIREEIGFDPGKPTQLKPVLYDQLQLPVITNKKRQSDGSYTHTPTLDKNAMERYELILERQNNPLAGRILEYRGWGKAVSSYYKSYLELVDDDGRLRPDYAMHGTVTGRYACSKPNLQQIPKESDPKKPKPWSDGVKKSFQPAFGYELWEFDYSQLEFRMGAHFSREPKLLDVFNDPTRDIFNEMSADLGLPRQDCKTLTYSISYGAGAQRIMDVFGYNREKALRQISDFYANYPGLSDVSEHVKGIVEQYLKIKIWSGRYRHFRKSSDGFKAFNSFIQGGAADVVKHVMNRIRQELPEVRMLLQIHDSIVFELPVGRIEEYKSAIAQIMENPFEEPWRVRFAVDAHSIGSPLLAA